MYFYQKTKLNYVALAFRCWTRLLTRRNRYRGVCIIIDISPKYSVSNINFHINYNIITDNYIIISIYIVKYYISNIIIYKYICIIISIYISRRKSLTGSKEVIMNISILR